MNDLISRQAVLDILDRYISSRMAKYEIEDLPSVQPEQKADWIATGIEQGRNEAWEAARKIGQNSQSGLEYKMGFDFSKMKSYESANPSWWVVMNYSASEAIEKIREYEEKKQQVKRNGGWEKKRREGDD